jgi:hypothetical protein
MVPMTFLGMCLLKLHENEVGVNMKQITGGYAFCQTNYDGKTTEINRLQSAA